MRTHHLALLLALAPACRRATADCVRMSEDDTIAAHAAVLRLDVYGADARCDGSVLRSDGPRTALRSVSFAPDAPPRLDLPVGDTTLVLTAYADPSATTVVGNACVETYLVAGAECVTLALSAPATAPPPDLDDAPPDLADAAAEATTVLAADLLSPSQPDIAAAPDLVICDDAACPCAGSVDCPANSYCAAGACRPGCDVMAGHGCTGDLVCCNHRCADLAASASDCGACGRACASGSLCCGATCVVPANDPLHCGGCSTVCSTQAGDPSCFAGRCFWACHSGFAHCGSGNTGCDTPTDTLTDCGGCGVACETTHSIGATCAGSCVYAGCVFGWANCNVQSPDAGGCECHTPGCCGNACQQSHANGLGQSFFDCVPVGTHTYDQAVAACAAFSGDASQCHSIDCNGNNKMVCSDGAPQCACWGYAGGISGHVVNSGKHSPLCICPSNGPTWN